MSLTQSRSRVRDRSCQMKMSFLQNWKTFSQCWRKKARGNICTCAHNIFWMSSFLRQKDAHCLEKTHIYSYKKKWGKSDAVATLASDSRHLGGEGCWIGLQKLTFPLQLYLDKDLWRSSSGLTYGLDFEVDKHAVQKSDGLRRSRYRYCIGRTKAAKWAFYVLNSCHF